MKKCILSCFLFIIVFCFQGCFSSKSNEYSEDITIINNEVNVSTAMGNLKDQIYLSEWVDHVEYIPLETLPNNLLSGVGINITPEYIFWGGHCFDWTGKYINQIGRIGSGPCENPGDGYYLIFVDGFFYSCGMKFIEYDSNGDCTGKMRNLFKIENAEIVGKFANIGSIKRTGHNIITFDYPDTVYFFNTDLEIISTYLIMEWGRPDIARGYTGHSMTHYEDTVIFYNYYTDTVYYATENTLIPRWVVKLDEEDKFPLDYLYDYEELVEEAVNYMQGGNVENARICEMIDGKTVVLNVYETINHIFLECRKAMFAREFRKLPPGDPPLIICYDKSTGKMSGGKNIVDDVGGLGVFLPKWGIYDNKMISYIWPYELEELIQEKQEKGQKVDPRLLDLMDKVDIEDNPIMIVAHLKK